MTSEDKYKRYNRQILLKDFGIDSQEKLFRARILVIGAGGLGCPALQYLAAAGVGQIGIVDYDVVELTNLHRQVLYSVNDIGKSKAITAAEKLAGLNPDIVLKPYNVQLTNSNALELIAEYDLVIDGSDNFSTRYLVNDACVILNKPLVYGAVLRFEGQVGVFNLKDEVSGIVTNYRDLFPEPPAPGSVLSCRDAGVLGVLPGIIGTMQATEAIKIITGIGQPLNNRVISYNALDNTFYEFRIFPEKRPGNTPKDEASFASFNYEWFCNPYYGLPEISSDEFDDLRANERITIIDVREPGELPLIDEFICKQIPLSDFENTIPAVSTEEKVVILCKSGRRSLKAVRIAKDIWTDKQIMSLAGGIDGWKDKRMKTLS